MKKKINIDSFDKFFYSTSKIIIYIPIAILVIALLLKFNQSTNIFNSDKANPSITPTPSAIFSNKQIDLQGPYKCSYKNNKVNLEAYVKNGKAIATITQKDKAMSKEKYYFDGDCIYVNEVKKTCGLKGYVGMFTGMMGTSSGLFDQLSSKYLQEKVDINTLLASCKKEDFKDAVFD